MENENRTGQRQIWCPLDEKIVKTGECIRCSFWDGSECLAHFERINEEDQRYLRRMQSRQRRRGRGRRGGPRVRTPSVPEKWRDNINCEKNIPDIDDDTDYEAVRNSVEVEDIIPKAGELLKEKSTEPEKLPQKADPNQVEIQDTPDEQNDSLAKPFPFKDLLSDLTFSPSNPFEQPPLPRIGPEPEEPTKPKS